MEVWRRVGLLSLVLVLMAGMITVSALTGTAQGNNDQYNDESGQYEPEGAPPAPKGDDVLYCAPEWLREWDQAQGWWYFWWYKWCHDEDNGWLKVYGGWEWWGPVEED